MKRDERGVAISSVSGPRISIALMLEQLQVEPGHRVLEIGSGGYNAALLRELVGPAARSPRSTSTGTWSTAPAAASRGGLPTMCIVLCADGEFGAPEHAPFDRIIVTAGAWDIPPAWADQLADGRTARRPAAACAA